MSFRSFIRSSRALHGCMLACLLPLLTHCNERQAQPESRVQAEAVVAVVPLDSSPLQPIPAVTGLDPKRVRLGEQLFSDVRLSGDSSIACSSCHSLQQGGADARPVSIGVHGAQGTVNSPTVFNSSLSFRQFWDGRAASLEEQVDGPLSNPLEMASNWTLVVDRLNGDKALRASFEAAYAGAASPERVRDAIATFERSLNTPNGRFDRYLLGEKGVLNALEQHGYRLFTEYGCAACHQGAGVGGNMYQRFGVMGDYFADRGNPTAADLGRYNVTHREEDRHVFKVPSLRNVSLTAPYFHDSSAATLDAAVRVMARYQLGRELDGTEASALVAFLGSLAGEYQGKPL